MDIMLLLVLALGAAAAFVVWKQLHGHRSQTLRLMEPLGSGFFSAVYLAEYDGKKVAVKPANRFGHGQVPWAKGGEQVPAEHPTGLTGPDAIPAEFAWADEVDALRAASKADPGHIVELVAEVPLSALAPDAMKKEQQAVQAQQGGFVKRCQSKIKDLPQHRSELVQHMFANAAAFAHLGPSSLMVLGLCSNGTLADAVEKFDAEKMCVALKYRGRAPSDVLRVREAFVAEMSAQLAAGVVACHRAGFLHMDVHLQNALLDDGYCVRLSDFGVTRSISALPTEVRAEAEKRKFAYRVEDFVRWTMWDDEALATAMERMWDPTGSDRAFLGVLYPETQIARSGFHARDKESSAAQPEGPLPQRSGTGTFLLRQACAPEPGSAITLRSLKQVRDALLKGLRSHGIEPPTGDAGAAKQREEEFDAAIAAWQGQVRGAELQQGLDAYIRSGVVSRVASAAKELRKAAGECLQSLRATQAEGARSGNAPADSDAPVASRAPAATDAHGVPCIV